MRIILFLLSLMLVACSNTDKDENIHNSKINFPKTVNLISKDLQIPEVTSVIGRLIVVDSNLVIYQKKKDTLFSIFNIKDDQLIHRFSFGSKGRGPNEFNISFSSTFKAYYKNSVAGFAVGNNMNDVRYYQISNLLNKDQAPYKEISLPTVLNGFRAIAYISDSMIIGAPYGLDKIDLIKYENINNSLIEFVHYPNDYPMLHKEVRREVYGCYIANSPDNMKLARVFSNMGKIEIYHLNNNSDPIVITYLDFPVLGDNLNIDNESLYPDFNDNYKIFSWGIRANDKYIYVLILNELYKNIAGDKGLNFNYIPQVHVFDWQGNPIVRCIFDSHFVMFDVDKDGNYLYSNSENDDIIKRYEISHIYNNIDKSKVKNFIQKKN